MGKKLTNKEFIERFNIRGKNKLFIPMNEYISYQSKMIFKCLKCNKIFEATPNNLLKEKYGCPECAKIDRKNSEYLKKLTGNIDKVNNKLIELYPNGKYTLLSTVYINNKNPLELICNECNTVFKMSYVNICKGKGCKYCNKQKMRYNSKGYKLIRKYLKENNYNFEEEFIFPDCKYIRPLKFDFKININNYNFILLEFDGEFHYRNTMNPEEYNKQILRDNIKNKYCKDNNLNLLRISYKNINNIKEIIENYISNISSTTIETMNDAILF